MQYWEESERGNKSKPTSIRPYGCSLHITEIDYKSYLDEIYSTRDVSNIPSEYDRIVGELIEVNVSDEIYNEILKYSNSLRIMQHSLNNLKKLQDIQTIIPDELDN